MCSGAVVLEYAKANTGQLTSVTAIGQADPATVTVTNVFLQYNDMQGAQLDVMPLLSENRGMYTVYTFEANPPDGNSVGFWVIYTEGGTPNGFQAPFAVEYYSMCIMWHNQGEWVTCRQY